MVRTLCVSTKPKYRIPRTGIHGEDFVRQHKAEVSNSPNGNSMKKKIAIQYTLPFHKGRSGFCQPIVLPIEAVAYELKFKGDKI